MRFVSDSGCIATSFRTLPRFRAVRAATIAQAASALGEADRPAVLAGGTDLPARFNEGFQPTDLIDISRIAELRGIAVDGGSLVIGAAVTHAAGASHPEIERCIPGFASAWSRIANVRIRLSATLGGNLMARRTRYEGAILLTALDARLRFAGPTGGAEVPVEALWSGEAPPGLLTHIVIPLRPGLRLDYDRSLRPIMTQALAVDMQGNGRIVTATEHVVPRMVAVIGCAPGTAFGTARYADPVTSDDYINRVSRVLCLRQLERVGRVAG